MNAFIGGTTVGTQYSQLQVGGSATLAGTLTVALASGFTPTIGSTFTVLIASSISGKFSNSTIAINSSEHFNVSYTSTGVVLTVASGTAPQSGVTAQSHLVAALSRKQPEPISGLRRWIRTSGGDHILSPIGVVRRDADSDRLMAISNRMAPATANWEHSFQVTPPALSQPGFERMTPSNNWSLPVSGVSYLRKPVTGILTQRVPVKILSPTLSRLQR
jgi:hypothetical protein